MNTQTTTTRKATVLERDSFARHSQWGRRSIRSQVKQSLYFRRLMPTASNSVDLRDLPACPHPDAVRLLTVPEACAALRISRWALYSLIHKRQLRTIRIGARRLVPMTAVLDLIGRLEEEAA